MTDEQITALAREYAEETHHGNTVAVDEAISTIRFLLRRYCLVKKKRVELYKHELLNKRFNAYCGVKNDADTARLDLLKSLFPEIGKEVER